MSVPHCQMLSLNRLGERESGKGSSKTSALWCRVDYGRGAGIDDADFTVHKPRRHKQICSYFPPSFTYKGAWLLCTLLPNWFVLEICFNGMYIYNSASFCQLPPAEVYQFIFPSIVCHFLLFCILANCILFSY